MRQVVTLVLVLAAYALLAIPRLTDWAKGRVPTWAAGRPAIALAGGLLLVLLGLVGPVAAWRAIDLRTLALLTGMMLLVGALEAANVFAVLASRMVVTLATPAKLLAGSMAVVAVLSALVLNDAVVLFFTPVLLHAARSMGVRVFPFLAAEAIAANLGSAATPIGNPQNALIALAQGISFVEFASTLALLALVCLALGILYCVLVFRHDLAKPEHRAAVHAGLPRVSSPRMLAIALAAVALALAGFVLGPGLGIPLWASALGAGTLALVLAPAARQDPVRIARSIDPGILVFFVGLFVLMEGFRVTGATDLVGDAVARVGTGGFVIATAVLSNLVSNVPAVLLLLPAVDTHAQALLLAAASTFAGNATFFGSAATVIVAETARARGEEMSVARFTLVGFPLAVVTLFLAWVWLG